MKKFLLFILLIFFYCSSGYSYELENCYLSNVQGDSKSASWIKKKVTKKFDENAYEALYFDISENGIQKVFILTEDEIQREKSAFKPVYEGHKWERRKFLKSNYKIIFFGDEYIEAEKTGIYDTKLEINLKNGLVVQSDRWMTLKYQCELNLKKQSGYLDYWWALILIIAITFFIYTQSASRLKKIKIRRK